MPQFIAEGFGSNSNFLISILTSAMCLQFTLTFGDYFGKLTKFV